MDGEGRAGQVGEADQAGRSGTDGFVLPQYGSGALTEILPSALAALGVPGERNILGLPPAACYVVLLVDALGWRLLQRDRRDAPYLGGLAERGRSITSGVPSTTAASLVGLGTGLPPGRHGVVGYTMGVPGGRPRLLNTLKWDSAIPPREWQPYGTVLERAVDAGVFVTSVGQKSLQGSGLTIAGLRGGGYLAADSVGQQIDRVVQACQRGRPALVYAYDGSLDWTGHRDGPSSAAFRHQLATIDAMAARLRHAMPRDAVLLVTGDHGMVDIPPGNRVDIDAEPELRSDVRLVAGDPRLRYLYTAPDLASEVAHRWAGRLGDQAVVLLRDEAIAAGWFGEVEDRVRPRLGNVVVAALAPIAIEASLAFPHEGTLPGWHGSLTADEMLVPLLVDG